jgi:molybdenum cofactor cytidylyltransferase
MGRPKLLLPWGRISIIGHLIQTWSGLGAAQIGVVCAADDDAMNGELDRLGFPERDRIQNPHADEGMFSSIQCAARWQGWKPGPKDWIIALGDQPHLQRGTLKTLLAFRRAHPDTICQPALNGKPKHPVLLPARAFAGLKDCHCTTLKQFLQQTSMHQACCEANDPGLAFDLDTPEDYQKALKLFSPH